MASLELAGSCQPEVALLSVEFAKVIKGSAIPTD